MNTLKLQIPSLLENIRIVESFIDNAKEKFKFTDDIYGNVMISVTESVSNAIKHGNNLDSSKSVFLTLEISDSKLTFTIEDEGEGFDFENLPDPTAPENLEKTGGRGIFLMQNLADEVSFHNKGKMVKLSFNIK